jgi:hypothetical protein
MSLEGDCHEVEVTANLKLLLNFGLSLEGVWYEFGAMIWKSPLIWNCKAPFGMSLKGVCHALYTYLHHKLKFQFGGN